MAVPIQGSTTHHPEVRLRVIKMMIVAPVTLMLGGIAVHFSFLVFAAAYDAINDTTVSVFLQEHTPQIILTSLGIGFVVWVPAMFLAIVVDRVLHRYRR